LAWYTTATSSTGVETVYVPGPLPGVFAPLLTDQSLYVPVLYKYTAASVFAPNCICVISTAAVNGFPKICCPANAAPTV